ncbi:UDP-N-acetylmuramoyl-tripeptide--D-alanyl-D-alanine ligase [Amphritea balenae]|uniref:UDP-N-acetylmuramoyl-tripeptide--D-alanyl-D-alanine ligase n=1 Tax=Amphritea balenae TaxID=452629 RepID=A0A3P1SSM6_9GAMM|nr:UDP-N-acetylmuramoyl-tripeptide--D-alanyl-D-alanine ligase [Amphritea balenae]RRD00131.1 UDP-N-acetylmuramoyl-tripeptide--D-alanyl-D-alanine ligase [Amphritea balenae]GGK76918.1 UDP-N-acetylmuramoyl-tripeptide--D-alanyl-D-alanine ligase [Amphritea balenae]
MNGPFRLAELAEPLSATLLGDDCDILRISTDTRKIQQGDLFIALKGDNFDAHDFIGLAESKGAAAVVVDHKIDTSLPQLIVSNTRLALGNLAAYNRHRFTGVLFAVTGSSGKTTVKEMLASISRLRGQTLATQGNLNNDIGVPLTLLRLSSGDQYAVIEMGASGPHEIAYSTHLAKPDIAILNNAMGAHLEGFGSLQGVVKAKAEIFQGLTEQGTAVVNLDDPHASVWLAMLEQQPLFTFSVIDNTATVFASDISLQDNGCYRFNLNFAGAHRPVILGLMGRHNVANALAAAAAQLADGCALATVADGLGQCRGAAGRMRPVQVNDSMLVIDDSYNANPDAVKAAVDALAELNGEAVLVLGDMAELGVDAEQQHRNLGAYVAAKGIDALYSCGPLSAAASDGFIAAGGHAAENFTDKHSLLAFIKQLPDCKRNLLVKGSRSAGMDEIVTGLTEGESR